MTIKSKYHIAVCYPGTDLEVEKDVLDFGFQVFRMTLPTPDRRSAFPGYMFVDPEMNPFIHSVDGIMDFLMLEDHYASVTLEQLVEIQRHIDQMFVQPPTSTVFDEHFSANRPLDFFDTPGQILFEKSVNIHRFAKQLHGVGT